MSRVAFAHIGWLLLAAGSGSNVTGGLWRIRRGGFGRPGGAGRGPGGRVAGQGRHSCDSCGRKSNKTTEDVDTNSSRSLGAANYLARSLPEVCGDLDLVRLSGACKWLSSFSRDGRPELQVAASQLASTIGRLVELRFLEFYELNLDADSAEETARKEIRHAAVQFLAACGMGSTRSISPAAARPHKIMPQ
jgi:hypothetical protein